MLPSTFVEAANFPVRWQEKDLQQYIADKLRKRGFRVELEVKANGGRADIVTSWQGGTIIEVKKYLDRNSIYQAFGQLNLYGLNNKYKLVVAGFMSPDAHEQPSAFKTASMIEQDARVSVLFVNLEQEWLPGNSVTRSWLPQFQLPKLPNFNDWKWWWNLVRHNPLIILLAIALTLAVIPEIQKPSTQINYWQVRHLK
ncbi:hypothetical protein ACE1AT_04800 [Pelatocladus sp. BLCC-F211]|uniref:hypothetical protein n=1 Tax=Pelatocladus sp. BLCC-F211 TaxID=3342752 RepID=UPI0035BAE145